jgi:hypothetical protein
MRGGFQPKRKYLVFSSIDPRRSAYSSWLDSSHRNYDVVLYTYRSEIDDLCVDYTKKRKGFKFENFYAFSKLVNVEHYDAVWIVDDDIHMSTEEINRMFDMFFKYDLLLGQPSYDKRTSSSWDISYADDKYLLRYTNFVENGVAIMSRKALQTCLPSMQHIKSGWGADFIWPKLLGFPDNSIAIIDEVQCYHPKSESSLNDKLPRLMHRFEGEYLMEKLGAEYFTPRVLGGILKH